MYEDLEEIATLRFNGERESISGQTRERVKEMKNEYAARSGSSVVRSGPHEAAIGRAQIEGAERLLRALFDIWVDLVKRRNGHISRPDVDFISKKLEDFARTQKGHLNTAFSQQRMGAVVNLLTQQAGIQLQASAAIARRELAIMAREHEAFPNPVGASRQTPQGRNPAKESRLIRNTAVVLNILIASPSDVSDERDIVERAIHDWNASHFLSFGILLNPIRWETHAYPASGDRPQAVINKQIVESGDILVGIFGYKLGTPTGVAQSGTIEEIEAFRRAGKYVALYFSTADVPRSADRAQLEALESYKKERQEDTLYFEFEDASSLREHLTRHLPKIVQDVHEKLHPADLSGSISAETSGLAKADSGPEVKARAQGAALLADLISELEDNLNCASRPRSGDVFRRPSTRVWLENRNKIALPPDLQQEVRTAYNQIGSWSDVVASGLNPNMGSMELNFTVSDLKMSLPPLIARLRKLRDQGS